MHKSNVQQDIASFKFLKDDQIKKSRLFFRGLNRIRHTKINVVLTSLGSINWPMITCILFVYFILHYVYIICLFVFQYKKIFRDQNQILKEREWEIQEVRAFVFHLFYFWFKHKTKNLWNKYIVHVVKQINEWFKHWGNNFDLLGLLIISFLFFFSTLMNLIRF